MGVGTVLSGFVQGWSLLTILQGLGIGFLSASIPGFIWYEVLVRLVIPRKVERERKEFAAKSEAESAQVRLFVKVEPWRGKPSEPDGASIRVLRLSNEWPQGAWSQGFAGGVAFPEPESERVNRCLIINDSTRPMNSVRLAIDLSYKDVDYWDEIGQRVLAGRTPPIPVEVRVSYLGVGASGAEAFYIVNDSSKGAMLGPTAQATAVIDGRTVQPSVVIERDPIFPLLPDEMLLIDEGRITEYKPFP